MNALSLNPVKAILILSFIPTTDQRQELLASLQDAVQRRDVFFFHFALDLAMDHLLQALFALNRVYFPSRKRSEMYLQTFKAKPLVCEGRLRQVIALGGDPETLDQSYEVWRGLVRDLSALGKDF